MQKRGSKTRSKLGKESNVESEAVKRFSIRADDSYRRRCMSALDTMSAQAGLRAWLEGEDQGEGLWRRHVLDTPALSDSRQL